MIKKAYKIVECRDGQLWFLYHGLNKSRIIPTGKWLKADPQELYNFTVWVAQSPSELKEQVVAAVEKFIQNHLNYENLSGNPKTNMNSAKRGLEPYRVYLNDCY